MKREEAIQVLQTALTAPFIYGEYAEAIDMAIEALRNCSEIPNGSLIRRQDIKYHTQLEARGNGQYEEVEVAYKNDIKSLPSADRPTGEWIRKYDKQINCYWYECNQCGEYRPRNMFGKEWSSPYCPNCGAKMGGESE